MTEANHEAVNQLTRIADAIERLDIDGLITAIEKLQR